MSASPSKKRAYLTSHPWIKFYIDLTRAPHELWLLLGEASSKCEHIAGTPLHPSVAEHMHQLYLAKGALATTAIEGNTLTEEEAIKHVEGTLELPPSRKYLAKEIDNITSACNDIMRRLIKGEPIALTADLIHDFNRRVLDGLDLREGVQPGVIPNRPVGAARYRGCPREDCEFLLEQLCDWLNGPSFQAKPQSRLAMMGLIKAVLAHLYIAWIHPFGDGNGRTARLIEFLILVDSGWPSPTAHLLSNHYNKTRSEYHRQLDMASGSGGDVIPFILYALRGMIDGLVEQIELTRRQHLALIWKDYVSHALPGEGVTVARRRRLVHALSDTPDAVPTEKLRDLNTSIARLYSVVSARTLRRDILVLDAQHLVYWDKNEKGWRARTGQMLGLLPRRNQR